MKTAFDIIIIGGGAAGFFTAINCASHHPELRIAILERGKDVLGKVKVSGGGRCNVTHACFDPSDLVLNYPRGEKELLGPFHQFACGDTFAWFEERDILLNIEDDGRVFPSSNSSQTIIDCFLNEIKQLGIAVLTNQSVQAITRPEADWEICTKRENFYANALVVAAGSSPKIWNILSGLGHSIVTPVPSLFTFNCLDERIKDIPGLVVPQVSVQVIGTDLFATGPLLITHWGFSAPAILKLSAFGARDLFERSYQFEILINFTQLEPATVLDNLQGIKKTRSKNKVTKYNQFDIPKRLWNTLVLAAGISKECRWADLTKNQLMALVQQLTQAVFSINGKSTFKEEFVTAGGVNLKEINFKRFESKVHKKLFLVGEVLDIDAVTGGFNFQNAWTGGYIAARAIASSYKSV